MSAESLSLPPATPLRRASRRGHPIAAFLLRRIATGIVTLLVVSIAVFLAVQGLPGDVTGNVLGRSATPETRQKLERELGLDRPLAEQYLSWVGGVVTGDFGQSTAALAQGAEDASVARQIGEPLRNSAILAVIVVALLIPLSLILGTVLARHAGRPLDHGVGGITLVFSALPEFVLGALLVVVFFSWLDVLPPTSLVAPGEVPLSNPEILVLPVATLLLTSLAWTTRLVRASMIESLRSEWVQTARLNGFRERFVVWRYALRNSLAPGVQVFTLAAQYIFGGVVLTEAVFSYPGIGQAFVQAVQARDVTTVEAIAVVIATIYIVMNIVADLLVMLLVPKLRTA